MNNMVVFPACGLYHELYYPDHNALLMPEYNLGSQGAFDYNSLYWSEVLSKDSIDKCVRMFSEASVFDEHMPIRNIVIAANPNVFIDKVIHAKKRLIDTGITQKEFYSCVETLNIFCSIYATQNSNGLSLTIQNGWHLQEESTKDIYTHCLCPDDNPYLTFMQDKVWPSIKDCIPKVVFFAGRAGYFSFALARMIKEHKPETTICLTRHSSEYYSMNKIDMLLLHNPYLQMLFDAVILEHFASTEEQVAVAIEQKKDLSEVKNLFAVSKDGSIHHTGYQTVKTGISIQVQNRFSETQRVRIANVQLFPDVKCYWNKCTFCGINHKYHFENHNSPYADLSSRLDEIKCIIQTGVSHIWFIDEALHPTILKELAEFLVEENLHVVWQARTRIERELLQDDLPALLARAGLRELRLGLESGSMSVLKRMHKFDDTFTFSLVEQICADFTSEGVSLHFPIIVGFPTEASADRRATYELLSELKSRFPLVTFNINIFELDIASSVFRNWKEYNIKSISFPCDPIYFLGNHLGWHNSDITRHELDKQRDDYMRGVLYPWMPIRSLTPPHILYRLSETIRNTLLWQREKVFADNTASLVRLSDVSLYYDSKKALYYIYCWTSHHYMIGNNLIIHLLNLSRAPISIEALVNCFKEQAPHMDNDEDLTSLILRLVSFGYLIKL